MRLILKVWRQKNPATSGGKFVAIEVGQCESGHVDAGMPGRVERRA